MTLARDLLEQAENLCIRDPKKPKQASLRRSLSAAYYALFHLLIDDALINLAPKSPVGLDDVIRRAFSHADMKNACKGFGSGNPQAHLKHLLTLPVSNDLRTVASTFVELQAKRHLADYDTSVAFSRTEVLGYVQDTKTAFSSWKKVRNTPNARIFLSALLLYKQWQRES